MVVPASECEHEIPFGRQNSERSIGRLTAAISRFWVISGAGAPRAAHAAGGDFRDRIVVDNVARGDPKVSTTSEGKHAADVRDDGGPV